MYQKLFENVYVSDSVDQVSPAISMEGGNAAQVEFVNINTGTDITVTIDVQESNDLENWQNLTNGQSTLTNVGYKTYQAPSSGKIGSAFIRLKVSANGDAVVAAGVNVFAS